MEIVLLLLKQNMVMMVYLLIGYCLYRKKLISTQGSADIGRLLLYAVTPVVLMRSYLKDFSIQMLEGLAVSFVLALLSLGLSILVSRMAFSKEEGIERFGAAFSNAGFIGLPLVQMTLGEEAVFYVASFVASLTILQWTYGVLTITGDRSAISFAKIRKNPVILGFLAGMLLFFLPIKLPKEVRQIADAIAGMNAPLAMIVLGVYLAQVPLKSLFTERIVYKCAAVRLLLIPALTVLLFMVFPGKYQMIKLTALIAAAAPVGANVAIFAQLYGHDYTRAVKEVCLSTLLCILTLPVIVGIAGMIF